MAKQRKKKPVKLVGLALYKHILKGANERNKRLPEGQRITYKELRQLVSREIYPAYKNSKAKSELALSRIFYKAIRNYSTECDPRYLPQKFRFPVQFFDIDAILKELPECIYARVNGEQFGATDIFVCSDYEYTDSGTKDIVEEIRTGLGNTSDIAEFFGTIRVRPDRADDNRPDSYYIEYVIGINGETPYTEDEVKVRTPKKKPKKKVAELERQWKKKLIQGQKEKLRRNKEKAAKLKKTKAAQLKKIIQVYKGQIVRLNYLYDSGEISGRTLDKEVAKMQKNIKELEKQLKEKTNPKTKPKRK